MAKRGRKTKKAKDNKGYLDNNKDNFTDYKVITGNNITMEGVSGNIYAVPINSKGQAGKGKLMKPGENHKFDDAVQIIEIPEKRMAQIGGNVGNSINNFVKWNLQPEPIWSDLEKPTFESNEYGVGATDPQQWGFPNNRNQNNRTPSYSDISGDRPWMEGLDNLNSEFDPSGISRITPPDQQGDYLESVKDIGRDVNPPSEQTTNTPQTGTRRERTTLTDPTSTTQDLQSTQEQLLNSGVPNDNNNNENVSGDGIDRTVEDSDKIQFENPYGGVSIEGAAQSLGQSLSYDGDRGGANTARGVFSGLKLLTGLGRNVMSGYASNKRNQYLVEEDNKRRRNQLKGSTQSLQKGGLTKEDNRNINEATDVNFGLEEANRLFERTEPTNEVRVPDVELGKYKDVGYFDVVGYENGKPIISNTNRNPMNYADNKANALPYLREFNDPNSFVFKYNNREQQPIENEQVVSRKEGGKVKQSEILSGAVRTGDYSQDPNVFVEDGEYVKDNADGSVQEIKGQKHPQGGELGGEPLNMDGKVLSDHNKIGGDLAKKYRDEYDVKVKAKDTPSTVMDKILKKTGYKSLTDDLTKEIEKAEKLYEKSDDIDEKTGMINKSHISGRINELNEEIQPLEALKNDVFEKLFEDQQSLKSASELREENGEEMAREGKEVKDSEVDLERPANISDEQWNVAKEIYQAAVEEGDKFPELTVSQAALETGWFKKPSGKNNYFGQKAAPNQKGSERTTHEYRGGNRQKEQARFRDYDSIREAVKDRMRLWGNRYQEADSLGQAVGIIMGADGNPAYATDPNYTNKIGSIIGTISGSGSRDTREQVSTGNSKPREDYTGDDPHTNLDGTPYEEGQDITKTVEFREWFHGRKQGEEESVSSLEGNPRTYEDGIWNRRPRVESVSTLEGNPAIGEETTKRTNVPSEQGTEEGAQEGRQPSIANLPEQPVTPPSTLQLTTLRQVNPREAEAMTVSADEQLAEINRQYMASKNEINKLPDSQRRAALSQLNSQTQMNINKIMSETNRTNAQIENRTEQFNTQTQNQAEASNEQLAARHESETLTALDNLDNENRAYFNRLFENQMGNYQTVNNMNLMNQNTDNFQLDSSGNVVQTGKAPSKEDLINTLMQSQSLSDEQREALRELQKERANSAKRGRKIK